MKSIFDNLKKSMKIAIAVIILICAAVILIALFTPNKRYQRAMNAGNKAYGKGAYEKAAEAYGKAIGIKEKSVDAYLGLLTAKESAEAEDVKDTYLAGLTALESMDENDRYIVLDKIIEYVNHESVVFAEDLPGRIDALERGYDITYADEGIKTKLTECVKEYVENLRVSEEYDSALEYVERFSEKADIDAKTLRDKLTKEKAFSEQKDELLKNVYDSLKAFMDAYRSDNGVDPYEYDFSKILSIDGSSSAEAVAGAFVSGSYTSIMDYKDDPLTGSGAGLYTFGDRYRTEKGGVAIPYYFYAGDYKDGVRSGFGVSFMKVRDNSYVMYVGDWADDLPTGKGTRFEKIVDTEGEGSYTQTYAGSWAQGLADGKIDITVTEEIWDGVIFTGEINAKNGICEAIPTETEDYVVLNIREGDLIGVLASDTEGYNLMITIWQTEGETIGALGLN